MTHLRISPKTVATAGAAALVLAPSVAFAAGGGDNSALIHTAMWHFINMAVLVGGIIYFARKGLRQMLVERRNNLMADLDAAAELKKQAAALVDEYETKLGGLDKEREQILSEYRQLGESERDRIIEEANEQAKQIGLAAERTISREVHSAKAAIEAEVLALAASLAEKTLVEKLDAKRQKSLIDVYMKDLETQFQDSNVQ